MPENGADSSPPYEGGAEGRFGFKIHLMQLTINTPLSNKLDGDFFTPFKKGGIGGFKIWRNANFKNPLTSPLYKGDILLTFLFFMLR
jgi:hypothetical protein